jgi:Uma2 family endonuclease
MSHGVRKEYVKKYMKDIFALSAPEICVEIISPSNTPNEMEDKIELFLEAGAKEVWLITEDGQDSFYNLEGQLVKSTFDIDFKELI